VSLQLADRWLWDLWFAQDGADVHVFYLQAPRSLGDPELRHRHATIGHAVSRDLRGWRVLPDALGAGPPGDFDDLATWTGCVLRHGGRWELFYTGISRADDGAVQRIGRATSDDLVGWERGGAVLEADPRWYDPEAWRDPWVEAGDDGRFTMLLCARANHGPADGRGVIGHATSADLRSWEVGPPLTEPGEFSQLEVPQLVHLGGAWRIVFCAAEADHSAARLARPGVEAQTGTHYVTARSRLGPYALDRDDFLVTGLYAGRVLEHDGRWWLLGWLPHDDRGGFGGVLSDPLPLAVAADGSLVIRWDH